MGLDVFVGTLTRYYSGEWELIAQQAAREMGLNLEVIRQHNPPDAIRDPDQIRPTVLAWRESLSAALADRLSKPLDWDESQTAPYFTDKPTWDCYSDLVLWAAYDEQRQLRRPERHVDDWSKDPAYQLSAEPGLPARYSHLYDVGLWFPCDFGFVFKTQDVGGPEITVGSSIALSLQLGQLNDRTWRAEPETVRRWRREGADAGAPLETGARFAFAVFVTLAAQAVEHALPMRLDW